MGFGEADAQGFRHLWPTVLVERRLPGAEAANEELARLVRDMERGSPDLTTDYRSGNLLGLENPAAQWLKDCINKTAIDYLAHCGLDYPVHWSLHAWANVNRLGDYHDPHNHPHCYLSGTYYVQVPKDRATRKNRGDVRPGCITFYDPRAQANMTAIRGDPQIEAEYTVTPEPGLILMWPSFLKHFVHPNLSRALRISISFNLMLKWSDSYLPGQD